MFGGKKPKTPKFHTRSHRKRSSWWNRWSVTISALVIAASAWVLSKYEVVDLVGSGDWKVVHGKFTQCGRGRGANCVIDGDTVMLARTKVRLRDYNAPELDGECDQENALARRSRDELLDWLNQGDLLMDGGEEPPHDQYGRELRTAKRPVENGRDEYLSDHMIKAGLAQETGWDAPRGGWC